MRNGLSLLLSSKSFRRRHHGQEYKPFQFKFHILSGHRPELSEGTHVQWKFRILSGHRPELHLIVLYHVEPPIQIEDCINIVEVQGGGGGKVR